MMYTLRLSGTGEHIDKFLYHAGGIERSDDELLCLFNLRLSSSSEGLYDDLC